MSFVDRIKSVFSNNDKSDVGEVVTGVNIEGLVNDAVNNKIECLDLGKDADNTVNEEIKDYVNSLVEDKLNNINNGNVESVYDSNDKYTVYIKDFQFKDDTGIKRVDFPSTLEKIGLQAFDGCTGLKTINFSNTNPPLVMNDAFTGVNGAVITVPCGCLDYYKNTVNMPDKELNEYKEDELE